MSLVSGNYIRASFETDTRRECHFRGRHYDSVLVRCCDHLVAFRQIVARLRKTRYASWELIRWSSIHRTNLKLVPFLSQGTKCRPSVAVGVQFAQREQRPPTSADRPIRSHKEMLLFRKLEGRAETRADQRFVQAKTLR